MSAKDLINQCLIWEGKAANLTTGKGKARPASQREIARIFGMSHATISMILNDKIPATLSSDVLVTIHRRYKKPWSIIGKLLEK